VDAQSILVTRLRQVTMEVTFEGVPGPQELILDPDIVSLSLFIPLPRILVHFEGSIF